MVLPRAGLRAALAVLATAGASRAQEAITTLESWRVTRYAAEGLRSPVITGLVQTPSGRVWVSTSSGIAWFDGWRFVEGRTEPNALNRAAVAMRPMGGDSLAVMMNNILYVGDTTGFVHRAILVNEQEEQVRGVAITTQGMLLLVAYGQERDSVRLMRWDGTAATELRPPAPLTGRDRASLHPAPGGGAWLNTSAGLYRLENDAWSLRVPARGSAMQVIRLVESPTGEVVASLSGLGNGPAGNGVWTWSRTTAPQRAASEGDDVLIDLALDGSRGFLAVHRAGHLRRRLGGRWSTYDEAPARLMDVRATLRDATGDLWVGTGQGLILLRESSRLWHGTPIGFPSLRDRVNALARAPDGALWAGTADGLDIHEPDGRVRHLREAGGVPLRTITAVARDSAGNMWIGSGSDLPGALRFDGRNWRHFTARDGLGAERVHRIVVTRSGAVWFLGIGSAEPRDPGPGAFVLDSGVFRRWGTAEGLPSGRVYDFAEAADGTRWFGTINGLSRWRAGTWTHWTERRGRAATRTFAGTPIRVFALAVDGDGQPWFGDLNGTFPYGLGTIEADTLRFYDMRDGLPANQVQGLQVGPDRTLWVGTVNGLAALRDGTWYRFGTDRGLGFPQIWPIITEDSSVTVGTLGGGVRHLSLSAAAAPAPRVLLTPPAIGTGVAALAWTPLAWRGMLPSALIETRYRVDGGAWSPWATTRSAILQLRGGRHVVELQAKGLYPPLADPAARAEFVVPGPLVTRAAFLIPVGTLLITVFALLLLNQRRQQAAARTVRDSERRFRALAASTTEGLAISVGGRIIDANEQLRAMLGDPSPMLLGRSLDALLGVEAARVEVSGAPVRLDLRRTDGSTLPVEVRQRPVPMFGAEALVTTLLDLSEREATRSALRASEERFETIFRKSPTAIMLTGWPEATILDVSEGFEVLTGHARAQLVGHAPVALGILQDDAVRQRIRAQLEAHGAARGHELQVVHRDGTLRSVLGTFVRLDVDGRPSVLSVLTDITDRRTLEAQLLQSQKMEAIGRLAGGVAHDFNNLLTVIVGHAELLRHGVGTAALRADVEDIQVAAQRAADLTRQLLTFARKQRISPRIVNLTDLLHRTQRMLGRLLGEHIAIESRIEPRLPLVLVDAGQLEQVIVNLAVNARDAMPKGGRLRIEAEAVVLDEAYARDHAHLAPGRFVCIAISDTGMGIPDEVLPRIFEPFFTTKEVGQGTGLGLAICYGIVREAGGHIAVYSEVGHGTTVRVYLPESPSEEEREGPSAPKPLPRGAETILVVEDEALVRNLVVRVLRSLGYSVTEAGDLNGALAALQDMRTAPALLVTDVVLPGPGGPEIAKAVRARVEGIRVLYISGYTERGANQTVALDAPLLSKPFTPEELAHTVRELLDGPGGGAGGRSR